MRNCEHSFDKVDLKREPLVPHTLISQAIARSILIWLHLHELIFQTLTRLIPPITQSVVLRVLEEFQYQKILPFVAKKINKVELYQLEYKRTKQLTICINFFFSARSSLLCV